jgi:VWFA-related protein
MRNLPVHVPLIVGWAVVALLLGDAGRGLQAQSRTSRERTLFVSAVDEKGEPVDGLDDAAFVVREDGVRREVLRVSRATEPIDIAVLVDNSAAMTTNLTLFREGISKFLTRLVPANLVALITLADRPTISVDYTRDPTRLSAGIGRLFPSPASGMTLLDAVVETSRGMTRRESSRAVIVPIITDGQEFTNRYYRDVVKSLVTARIAMHAVTVGQFQLNGDQPIRERAFFLEAGARDSGGQRIFLLTAHGLDPALQRIARELSSQYKVVYARPESLIPPEKASITSGRPGVTMRGAPARGE